MINNIQIKNFKCWEDTGTIHLPPITVFFGANSVGKSSVGQFLMMLKQSTESSDRKTVFHTGDENTAVDMGLPKDIIYRAETDRLIEFKYDWNPTDVIEINDAIHRKRFHGNHISFCGKVGLTDGNKNFEVESATYQIQTDENGEIEFSLLKKKKTNKQRREYELVANNYELVRKQGRAWNITSPVRFYGFPDEAVAHYQNVDFVQNFNLINERLFSLIYYLGPLRYRAKRLYTWLGSTPKDVGTIGEDAISAILAAKEANRKINLVYRGKMKAFDVIVAEMLCKMGLIEDFVIKRISNARQDYEVKVRTTGSDNYVDVLDVGVGVSQVLPVIVELFYAPPGSTIIIEQPELHLHPSAQAGLADVIIDAIHAREEHANRNIQLIIESHSEHFLRRLQRRIAEGVLEENEFSGYFVSDNPQEKITKLEVDEYGDITNWPPNFFGDIRGDIYEQTMVGIKKRRSKEI